MSRPDHARRAARVAARSGLIALVALVYGYPLTRNEPAQYGAQLDLQSAPVREFIALLKERGTNVQRAYLDRMAQSQREARAISQDLLDMLDDTRHDTSRLSCQVEWAEELDGAEVTIAPEW